MLLWFIPALIISAGLMTLRWQVEQLTSTGCALCCFYFAKGGKREEVKREVRNLCGKKEVTVCQSNYLPHAGPCQYST